ncbi:hypothetical protein DL96DRAFT_1714715 [Flagelloscypha sp. PMI_526]|nr:hypothetical protein DL96DRAFT_1714715 [Flagelloscypha sp. PMI_526]
MSPVPEPVTLVTREDNSNCQGSSCFHSGVPPLSTGAIIGIAVSVFFVLGLIAAFCIFLSKRRATKQSRERYARDYYYRYNHAKSSQMEETMFTGTTTALGTELGFGGSEKKPEIDITAGLPRYGIGAEKFDSEILEVPQMVHLRQ